MEAQFNELAETTGAVPPALETKPELGIELAVIFECFLDCETDRQAGFSVGPIPYRSVATWCQINQIADPDQIGEIWQIVHKADMMLLAKLNRKASEIGKEPEKAAPKKLDYVQMRRTRKA